MTASAASPRLAEQARVAEEPHRGQWQMFWRRFRRHRLALMVDPKPVGGGIISERNCVYGKPEN